MCRKLVFLIAVLGLVSTAWADDWNVPEWRNAPGSTYSQWTYDAPAPQPTGYSFPSSDAPEVSWIVPHPEKVDPGNFLDRAEEEGWIQTWWEDTTWVDDSSLYEDNFAMQIWGGEPTWVATYVTPGGTRTGVLKNIDGFSFDLYNFSHDPSWEPQPWKYMQIQITWQSMDPFTLAYPSGYELEYFGDAPPEWSDITGWQDPPGGWDEMWDVPLGDLEEIWYQWWEPDWSGWEEGEWLEEPGFWMGSGIGWGNEEGYWAFAGWQFGRWDGFIGAFLDDEQPLDAMIENAVQGDGWMHTKFYFEVEPNPDEEFFGVFWEGAVAIDQVVIDTICIPEPITMSLLGLGGLLLIRRRKR